MISKLVAWLSVRFPEQLVVSKAEYKELREEVAQLNVYAQAITELHKRLETMEKQVSQLNAANGFQTQGKATFKLER